MKRLILTTMASLALCGLATAANSSTTISANLTTSAEPGPIPLTLANGVTPRPTPFGNGTFVLNDAQTALTYSINVFNIDVTGTQTADVNDNLLAAHIHAGTTITPTFPVVFGFFGMPF